MISKKRGWFLISILSISFSISIGWTNPTHSQHKYPTKAIDIIVPFSAGGSTDLATFLTTSPNLGSYKY